MLKLNFQQQIGAFSLVVRASLPARGVSAIFGVSGAGKTSLINVIAGLTPPPLGSVSLNGRLLSDTKQKIMLPPEQRRLGYVFQDARLFPHLRVRANLQYGMAKPMRAQFDSVVALLGIAPLLHRFPGALSGGEKQRVAIGRALLSDPQILLLDEPLASLDLPRKRELLSFLQTLTKQLPIPILYVTHSLDEILQLAENVLVLDNGRVKCVGPLEQVWASSAMRPWLVPSAYINVLHLPVRKQHARYAMTALDSGAGDLWVSRIDRPVNSKVRVLIRPADISLSLQPVVASSSQNVVRASVQTIEKQGAETEVTLRIGQQVIRARISCLAEDTLALRPLMLLYAQIHRVSVIA